ncbi:MAG: PAS domain-containing protein [Trichocoleus desertorum ATA4-8-CV12]|nr:PAS domain-containing protein [Trichocoleus desertorum ATA4-8-CV12]
MTPEQFLEFARPLPEPMLLITGNGQILATNPPFSKMLGLPRQLWQGKMIFEMATDPVDKVKQYLRACSSSREMVIGSLTLSGNDGKTCLCRCEGAVIRPWAPESPALILLRLKNQESASS